MEMGGANDGEYSKKTALEEMGEFPVCSPRWWLALLAHPSPLILEEYSRRRARLFSVVSFLLFIFSLAVTIFMASGSGYEMTEMASVVSFDIAIALVYLSSRTSAFHLSRLGGVLCVWALSFAGTVGTLKLHEVDITSSSVTYLFSPAWVVMAATFLDEVEVSIVVVLDSLCLFFMPLMAGQARISTAQKTYASLSSLIAFHTFANLGILLSSVIHDHDQQQLSSSTKNKEPGLLNKWLLQPSETIVSRIWRRRSRALSALLLFFLVFTAGWTIKEIKFNHVMYAGSRLPFLIGGTTIAFCFLYIISRTHYTYAASVLSVGFVLMLPYAIAWARAGSNFSSAADTTLINTISVTSASLMGLTLLSAVHLGVLSIILLLPAAYSAYFPPNIIVALLVLAASTIVYLDMRDMERTWTTFDFGNVAGEAGKMDGRPVIEDASQNLLAKKTQFTSKIVPPVAKSAIFSLAVLLVLVLGICTGAVMAGTKARTPIVSSVVFSHVADGSPFNVTAAVTNADYKVSIDVAKCSPSAQRLKVVGEDSFIVATHTEPLASNARTDFWLNTGGKAVGDVSYTTLSIGDGAYSIFFRIGCDIEVIVVEDLKNNQTYVEKSVASTLSRADASESRRRRLDSLDNCPLPSKTLSTEQSGIVQKTAETEMLGSDAYCAAIPMKERYCPSTASSETVGDIVQGRTTDFWLAPFCISNIDDYLKRVSLSGINTKNVGLGGIKVALVETPRKLTVDLNKFNTKTKLSFFLDLGSWLNVFDIKGTGTVKINELTLSTSIHSTRGGALTFGDKSIAFDLTTPDNTFNAIQMDFDTPKWSLWSGFTLWASKKAWQYVMAGRLPGILSKNILPQIMNDFPSLVDPMIKQGVAAAQKAFSKCTRRSDITSPPVISGTNVGEFLAGKASSFMLPSICQDLTGKAFTLQEFSAWNTKIEGFKVGNFDFELLPAGATGNSKIKIDFSSIHGLFESAVELRIAYMKDFVGTASVQLDNFKGSFEIEVEGSSKDLSKAKIVSKTCSTADFKNSIKIDLSTDSWLYSSLLFVTEPAINNIMREHLDSIICVVLGDSLPALLGL